MKTKLILLGIIGLIISNYGISQNIPSYIPKNGLSGYWSFEGNAKDLSANQNHGTINGVKLVKDKSDKLNSAIEFSGTGNFVGFDMPFFQGKQVNSFTFYTRINFKDIRNSPNIWGKTLFWGEVNFMVTNLGEIQLTWANSITGNKYSLIKSLSNQVNINKWYDILISFENGNGKIYLDGKEIQTSLKWIEQGGNLLSEKEIEDSCNFKQDLGTSKLGVRYEGGSEAGFLNGIIDEFGIWNKSLSTKEINNITIPCIKQNATTSSFDKIILKNQSSIQLIGQPSGGNFLGTGITNNIFNPTKSKLGKNYVDYVFKNDSGCDDTTRFNFIVYDTLGLTCTKTDTVKVTKTIYDTIITKTTVEDTLKIKVGITTGIYANQTNTIKMFPNPTASDLVIDFGNQEMIKGYTLMITDILGKEVYKSIIVSKSTTIKLSSLGGKGIYRVNIIDENQKVINVKQIVLE
jgi:hypothetical protein